MREDDEFTILSDLVKKIRDIDEALELIRQYTSKNLINNNYGLKASSSLLIQRLKINRQIETMSFAYEDKYELYIHDKRDYYIVVKNKKECVYKKIYVCSNKYF